MEASGVVGAARSDRGGRGGRGGRGSRGRPRVLPSQLPRMDAVAALDPVLVEHTPVAAAIAVDAYRAAQRKRKQEQRAREIARNRAAMQIKEMATAAQAAKIQSELRVQRLQEREAQKLEKRKQLYEVYMATLAGDDVDVDAATQHRIDSLFGVHHPHVTPEEHNQIMTKLGTMSQREIAVSQGVSQSTVSRHANARFGGRPLQPRGRPRKLSDSQLHAAARFLFLNKTVDMRRATEFLLSAFVIRVSCETLSRHLHQTVGFRLGDFRRFPRDRNTDQVVDERFNYVRKMRVTYGETALVDALYYDEMKLSRKTKRSAWSIRGWIPTVQDEFACEDSDHITLLYCASPQLGTINWSIVEGSVDAAVVKTFLEKLVATYSSEHYSDPVRAFIMDNVSMHHVAEIQRGVFTAPVRRMLRTEFLPRYSPFLNPVEEVFARIKFRLAQKRSLGTVTDESRAYMKKALADEVMAIEQRHMMAYFLHTNQFIELARQRAPVFTQQHFEHSHGGDEIRQCPILDERVEALLDAYLPSSYSHFTPEGRQVTEAMYRAPTISMEVAAAFHEQPDGSAVFSL